MSGGFGLPVLNLAGALGSIADSYRNAYDDSRRQSVLAKLGDQLQGGDFKAAAGTAFGAGDLQTGVGLLKLDETRRKEALTAAADADFMRGFGGGFGVGGPVAAPGAAPQAAAGPTFASTGGALGDYLASTRARESGGNDAARNPNSTATGRYQFTADTWAGLARKYPNLGLTPDGRTDPAQQERAMQRFTADNADLLSSKGLPITPGNLYGAHFLGAGGAASFIPQAINNPDAPAASLAPKAAAANRSVFYNRDGSPKSAREVYAWMGGQGGPSASASAAPVRTASADPSFSPGLSTGPGSLSHPLTVPPQAQPPRQAFQPLDAQGGFLAPGGQDAPVRVATADPRAAFEAMPPGLSGSGRLIPGGLPASSDPGAGPQRAFPPSSDNNARNAPPPGFGGAPAAGRVMTMPGDAPVQVAQADGGAPQIPPDAKIGPVPADRVAQMGLGARIPWLARAIGNPNLSDGNRGLAKMMLKQAWDETSAPPAFKEFQQARIYGYTQARTPTEYAAEQARAKDRDKGLDIRTEVAAREAEGLRMGLQPGSEELRNYSLNNRPAVERQTEGEKITGAFNAREELAARLGYEKGTPAYNAYVGAGKLGADRDLTVGEKKSVEAADTMALASQQSIDMLRQAKELSGKAYAGPKAALRGQVAGYFGNEAGQATTELDNLVTTNALSQLKSIFGAAPTEGERKILLDIQGSSNLPHPLRLKIYDRAIAAADLRLQQNQGKADAIREGRYFRQGGGAAVRGNPVGSEDPGGQRAPAGGSSENRPGTVSAGDRFGQLVGSGMSKAQAYQQLHSEGY